MERSVDCYQVRQVDQEMDKDTILKGESPICRVLFLVCSRDRNGGEWGVCICSCQGRVVGPRGSHVDEALAMR